MEYTKQLLTLDQQISMLKGRGLNIADEQAVGAEVQVLYAPFIQY